VMVVGLAEKVPVPVANVALVFSVIDPAVRVAVLDVGGAENDPVRDAATGALAVRVRVGPLVIVTVWPPMMVVGVAKLPVPVANVALVFSVIDPAVSVAVFDVGRTENDPIRDAATGALAVRVSGLLAPDDKPGLLIVRVWPPVMVVGVAKVPVALAATAGPV